MYWELVYISSPTIGHINPNYVNLLKSLLEIICTPFSPSYFYCLLWGTQFKYVGWTKTFCNANIFTFKFLNNLSYPVSIAFLTAFLTFFLKHLKFLNNLSYPVSIAFLTAFLTFYRKHLLKNFSDLFSISKMFWGWFIFLQRW